MLNVSYYEEYPIFEPAEGGYYYAGCELKKTERLSRRQAKKKFAKIVEELLTDEMDEWFFDGEWQVTLPSRYIGEGCFWCIERKEGSHTRGWRPYC